ncbi:MAG: hypothetical protein GTO03_17360 [Planctomycetales bacterium]|nr:hypothetical protein [Planctomycetales bacterium]
MAQLLTDEDQAPLGPGQPHHELAEALAGLDLDQAFAPRKIVDHRMARACHSGLWLLHNYLDESHTISQEIGNPTGSFWHGIMHRREGDYGNAKYWFRRVGQHEIYRPLAAAAHAIDAARFSDQTWDPLAFVDLCQAAVRQGEEQAETLRRVARREWELLFDSGFRQAVG